MTQRSQFLCGSTVYNAFDMQDHRIRIPSAEGLWTQGERRRLPSTPRKILAGLDNASYSSSCLTSIPYRLHNTRYVAARACNVWQPLHPYLNSHDLRPLSWPVIYYVQKLLKVICLYEVETPRAEKSNPPRSEAWQEACFFSCYIKFGFGPGFHC